MSTTDHCLYLVLLTKVSKWFSMPNNYSQIYIQIVFAVQARQNLIAKRYKEELHKYMTGIVSERQQKLLAVHCMPD
jgi:putative transposase